tara:strand:- start:157 stop:624 length:468 start_codon:yes stop_codon:yes gene_type:complete
MSKVTLVKHAPGAPGLRYLGLGPGISPIKGIKQLQRLLNNNTLWAKSRSIKDIRKMLSRSTVTISLWKGDEIIGFGRATSDEIFRAVLWDVVVDKNHQDLGFGKLIVRSLLENNLVLKAERVYIMTTNCSEFYSKIGFQIESNQTLMTLNRDIYN